MGFTLYRTDDEIKKLWNDFLTEIYPLCYSYMKNENAADKALVKVFIELMKYEQDFVNTHAAEYWLLSAAEAVCSEMLHSWWENSSEAAGEFFANDLEIQQDTASYNIGKAIISSDHEISDNTVTDSPENINITAEFIEIMKLPAKFKLVFFLHCNKNFSASKIAEITNIPRHTVRNRLHGAKQFLSEISLEKYKEAYALVTLSEDKSIRLFEFVISKAHDEEFYSNIIPEEEQKDSNDYNNTVYLSEDFDDRANSIALLKSNLPKLLPGAVCIIAVVVISIWYFIRNPM